jgi:hypothetical protein
VVSLWRDAQATKPRRPRRRAMSRGALVVLSTALVVAGVAVGKIAFDRDERVVTRDLADDVRPHEAPPDGGKSKPEGPIFDIDPEKVVGLDYETLLRHWTAERVDAGGPFALTVADASGRTRARCRVDLEPVLVGLSLVRVDRVLSPEEAEKLWARYGSFVAKVRLRSEAPEDSIEFRMIVTENVREAIVLRAGRRTFTPSVPSEVFELLAEGCPRKDGEER